MGVMPIQRLSTSRRSFLRRVLVSGSFAFIPWNNAFSRDDTDSDSDVDSDSDTDTDDILIGYTDYRTNLPTRHANQVTMRACVVRADGSGGRRLAEELTSEAYSWTQFAGWSPDGKFAILGRGWESPENGAWEEEHKTFRMTEGWLYDMYLMDLASGKLTNLTSVERVSDYNSGLFFVPGDSNQLAFTALINGVSHPFVMDRDGRNKRDVSGGPEGFTYGLNASPDGRHIAYHKDYQIMVADADGANIRPIETGNPFNFAPQWSPDGSWLLFVSGEHYNCHPCIVRPDGTEFKKLADRGGYRGVTPVYDVYDFHDGSSDVPVWAPDGQHIYYTAQVKESVELMRVDLDGVINQLTQSPPRVFHYHPTPGPDERIVCGVNQDGMRRIALRPAGGGTVRYLTDARPGYGAMWPHWQPAS